MNPRKKYTPTLGHIHSGPWTVVALPRRTAAGTSGSSNATAKSEKIWLIPEVSLPFSSAENKIRSQ